MSRAGARGVRPFSSTCAFAFGLLLTVAACSRGTDTRLGASPVSAASPTVREPRAPRSTGIAAPAVTSPSDSARTATSPSDAALPSHLDDVATARDTWNSLRARYGDAAVAHATLHGAEGAETSGWTLFAGDPMRRIDVYLDDAGAHPAALYVREPSAWTRSDGVRVGMTTVELERLNGRPFVFSGFGWDYGGVVSDWKGGALSHAGRFVGPVTLCEPADAPAGYASGEGDFLSDRPVVRKLPPKVCELGVDLRSSRIDGPAAGDCRRAQCVPRP